MDDFVLVNLLAGFWASMMENRRLRTVELFFDDCRFPPSMIGTRYVEGKDFWMRLAIDEKPAMRNGLDDGAQTDCVEGREIGGRHNRWMGCSVGRARCVQLFSFFFRNLGKIDLKT